MNEIAHYVIELNSPDAGRRTAAAMQLARLEKGAAPAAIPLVRAAGDEAEDVRNWAVEALENLGPPSRGDAGALADLLGDHREEVAYWSATLLGRLQPLPAPAAEALAAALGDQRPISVRQRAAWALAGSGATSRAVLDALRRAAGSDDPRLARLARKALERANISPTEKLR